MHVLCVARYVVVRLAMMANERDCERRSLLASSDLWCDRLRVGVL